MVPSPTFAASALFQLCRDIERAKSALGGVIHTVAYGLLPLPRNSRSRIFANVGKKVEFHSMIEICLAGQTFSLICYDLAPVASWEPYDLDEVERVFLG